MTGVSPIKPGASCITLVIGDSLMKPGATDIAPLISFYNNVR